MNKSLILTAAAAALATGPAFAGSLVDPAPETPIAQAAPAPIGTGPDWTGFYGGVELGYGSLDSNLAGSDDGFIGGLIAGYDYDLGQWVIGAGIDYDFADINITPTTSLEELLRLKLRGGYKIGDGLLYATGGYAHADTDLLGNDDGYFIGAGYEHLISNNFSIGGEVLYHEFDNFNSTAADVEATTFQVRGAFRF